jgi:hypothetical protein
VFSDPALQYDQQLNAQPGLMDKFLDWLSEFLFGDLAPDNVRTARSIIIWTVVLVVLGIAIWLLSRSELASLIKAKPKATAFNFTDITEDLNSVDFDQKIHAALMDHDERLAIRWHYLKALFLLDKKQLISFSPFKTNIEYGQELKGKTFFNDFTALSRIYEYVWYGQFRLNNNDYHIHRGHFEAFEKQMHA